MKVSRKTSARQNQTGITKEEKSELSGNNGEVLAALRAETLAIGLFHATADIDSYLLAGYRAQLLCKLLDSLSNRLACQAGSTAAIEELYLMRFTTMLKRFTGHYRRSLWMFHLTKKSQIYYS